MSKINFYLLEYAFNFILRNRSKNIFIAIIFTLLVALLSTLFLLRSTLEYSLQSSIEKAPDIVVQNYKAGLPSPIEAGVLDRFLEIDGVRDGVTRVYGFYDFAPTQSRFYLYGVDPFEEDFDPDIAALVQRYWQEYNSSKIVVSDAVLQQMKKAYYDHYFNFIKPDGKLLKLFIGGHFSQSKRKDLRDYVLVEKSTLQKIFGYAPTEVSDIALAVANSDELPFIAQKIALLVPNAKVITKADRSIANSKRFAYTSGIFLMIFTIALFTFFIIVYDKANGLSSEEKREIGILKALGWRIEDVLHAKFYEAAIVAFFSFTLGLFIAFVHVFFFGAPLFAGIFLQEYGIDFDTMPISMHFDTTTLFLLFLVSVPTYIAATIIPAWRVATMDADEVMR